MDLLHMNLMKIKYYIIICILLISCKKDAISDEDIIDEIDNIIRIFPQSTIISPKGYTRSLIKTPNAAIFGNVDNKVVTIDGAP